MMSISEEVRIIKGKLLYVVLKYLASDLPGTLISMINYFINNA